MKTKQRHLRYPIGVRRFLETRPRAELLAHDWSRTNVAIAPLLRLTSARVAMVRQALREEGYSIPETRRGAQVGSYRSRDKYRKAGIGKLPDRVVAEKLGVTKQAVYQMRRMMGIPVLKKARMARGTRT